MMHDAAPAAVAVADPAAERDRLVALYDGERDSGWATCLLCRMVYRDAHTCPPPRPSWAGRHALVGAFEDRGQHRPGFFGNRVGIGFYWMGSTEDLPRPCRQRHWHPRDPNPANSAWHESRDDADRWRRHRARGDFVAGAPRIALAAFRDAAGLIGVRPREAGRVDPPGSRRYRVIGAARVIGPELVIDLGFWLGPYHNVNLEPACTLAAQAVVRRWRFSGQAGFAWDEVKT